MHNRVNVGYGIRLIFHNILNERTVLAEHQHVRCRLTHASNCGMNVHKGRDKAYIPFGSHRLVQVMQGDNTCWHFSAHAAIYLQLLCATQNCLFGLCIASIQCVALPEYIKLSIPGSVLPAPLLQCPGTSHFGKRWVKEWGYGVIVLSCQVNVSTKGSSAADGYLRSHGDCIHTHLMDTRLLAFYRELQATEQKWTKWMEPDSGNYNHLLFLRKHLSYYGILRIWSELF